MTSRERLMAAVHGEPADRVPWGPEINAHFQEKHLRAAGLDPATLRHAYARINRLIGADAICSAGFYTQTYSPDIVFRQEAEGDEIRDIIETSKGVLVKKSRWEENAHTTFQYEPMLKCAEDYRIYQYVVENTRIEADYEGLLNQARAVGDDGMVTLTTPQTPFMDLLMGTQGPEPALYGVYDYPREMGDLMDAMLEKARIIYRLAAEAPEVEVVRPFEDTSTMLTGPQMFRKYCEEPLREYAQIVHAGGKQFVPHLCGHLKDVLADLREIGLDGAEAVTPPPTGNTPARLVREEMGSDFLIIGGIDPTRFSLMGLPQVERMVRDVLEEMRGDRRFILGCEEISVMALFENATAVSRVIREEFADFYA